MWIRSYILVRSTTCFVVENSREERRKKPCGKSAKPDSGSTFDGFSLKFPPVSISIRMPVYICEKNSSEIFSCSVVNVEKVLGAL